MWFKLRVCVDIIKFRYATHRDPNGFQRVEIPYEWLLWRPCAVLFGECVLLLPAGRDCEQAGRNLQVRGLLALLSDRLRLQLHQEGADEETQ